MTYFVTTVGGFTESGDLYEEAKSFDSLDEARDYAIVETTKVTAFDVDLRVVLTEGEYFVPFDDGNVLSYVVGAEVT